MNEQDPKTVIQNLYAAFSRGDLQTILDHLAPDVQWTMDGPAVIPYAGRRKGVNEVRGFFEALATTQENQKLVIDEFITEGDKVVTTGRYSALVKTTGKRMDCAVAHVFTVKNGKIVKFVDFVDTAHMADAYVAAAAAAH